MKDGLLAFGVSTWVDDSASWVFHFFGMLGLRYLLDNPLVIYYI